MHLFSLETMEKRSKFTQEVHLGGLAFVSRLKTLKSVLVSAAGDRGSALTGQQCLTLPSITKRGRKAKRTTPMEQKSPKEMTALSDVAYVICYGHFPNSDNSGITKTTKKEKETKPTFLNESDTAGPDDNRDAKPSIGSRSTPEVTVTTPDSTSEETNPFEDNEAPSSEDPFSEESKDNNPFSDDSKDGNPFSDDGNPFGEDLDGSDENNPFTEDLNPFSEDVPGTGPKQEEESKEDSSDVLTSPSSEEIATKPVSIEPPSSPEASQPESQTPAAVPDSSITEVTPIVVDPYSSLAKAITLKDIKKVSQVHAREIIVEAFNVTKLDFSRLVEETRNTKVSPTVELQLEEIRTEGLPVSPPSEAYPLIFLKAKIGQETKFLNFSSTSATNTIEQSMTLSIQNMYNDILILEVWSANILPKEEPQSPPKLDLLGRIMTGGVRLKKEDLKHTQKMKQLKEKADEESHADVKEEPSFENSPRTPSPKAVHERSVDAICSDDSNQNKNLQNGDSTDHEDQHSKSVDISDSISISSEMSNDPVHTSTPRGGSNNIQHLEVPDSTDTPNTNKKKGFKSSFRLKGFGRSSKSKLNKSNQSLNITDSPSPDLPRRHPDACSIQSEDSVNLSTETIEKDVEMNSPRITSRRILSPRPLRPFKNLKIPNSDEVREETDEVSPPLKSSSEKAVKVKMPNNPEDVQEHLTRSGNSHLQAECLAYVSVPLKSIVGEWVKEGWIPMTVTPKKSIDIPPKAAKKKKKSKSNLTEVEKSQEKDAKVQCKMHLRVALPAPAESELSSSAFDSYNSAYSKLVNLQLQTMSDLTDYKGSVGAVGKILLDQLIFFSRVSESHQKLASWLVLSERKPYDSILLLPFLLAIKSGLQEGQYVTAQKLKLGESLSKWVRHVMAKEFEVLHSSFPSNSHLVHLPRLENFLRCFHTIEEDTDLRILFEREMNLINFPSLTDQLQGALARNAEIWIEALNKEPLHQQDLSISVEPSEISPEDAKWHDDLRRAGHLTKPIDDFLVISIHTYQPIFMTEMCVDYLYWVIPKFLTAALHLINKTHRYPIERLQQLPKAYVSSAAQAVWRICSNISGINKIGMDSKIPVHLIEQDFRTAFSNTVLQWLALSESLSLEELDNDLQQEEFVAVHPDKGYSHSAVSMVDILRAIMNRLQGLCWPGGLRPGKNTLARIGKQIVSLVNQYATKVTAVFTSQECITDRIPTEVCVVVRNVEHVCDTARQHLTTLATWAEEELQVQEELPEDEAIKGYLEPEARCQKLQEQIDSTAEKLLEKCLPKLEVVLRQGVSCDNPEYMVEQIVTILQPIEDRLYFAEPLLYELWNRLFKEAEQLMLKFQQGAWRDDLKRLHKVITGAYTFLTDSQRVGVHLQEEAVQEYEKLIEELKMSGASSPSLIAMYYNERYAEQCKEIDAKSNNVMVVNVTFSRDGLRVCIIQAPGNSKGVLVKARVEPQVWFPHSQPQKTSLVKSDVAVFDETLHFNHVHHDGPHDETMENSEEGGGVLVLQVRTPNFIVGSVVHYEAIVPLATVQKVTEQNLHSVQHLRLPCTRPWNFKNYKALNNLKSRVQEQSAVEFLKAWHTRWEASEQQITPETLSTSFLRGKSLRLSSRRKGSTKEALVK